MKKMFVLILIFLMMFVMTSCDESLGSQSDFNGIHILVHNGQDICVRMKSTHYYNTGIRVETEEFGPLLLSEGTYIVYKDKCPICGTEHH